MTSINLLDKVSKVSLYLAVFLIPLWFLPFTQNVLVYQKQTLLVLLVFLGLVAWLAKAASEGGITLRVSKLYIPVALTVLVVGISSAFSLWSYGSFWGWPLDLTDNFITIAAFAALYFLIVNTVQDSVHLFRILLALLVSVAIAGIFAILQLYGLFLLPFAFAKNVAFNTIGNINSVAMLAAMLLPLAIVLSSTAKVILRWFLLSLVLILSGIVVLINFTTAWIVLIAGLLVLLAFGMWSLKKKAEFGWVSLPMALIIVALFFIMFPISLPGAPDMPVEISPSQSATLDIAKSVISESPIVGSGPGTFILDYARYHSISLNETSFWATRFASGSSEILDWTITKGILGLLAFLFLLGTVKLLALKTLVRWQGDSFTWMLGLGTFASFVAVVVGQFLYPSNFILWFLFWVLLGGVGMFVAGQAKQFQVASRSIVALASSFVFLLVLIFGIGLLFLGGQKYAAEVQYLQGAILSQQGDVQGAIGKILSAASLNNSVDLYWRDLSQMYLARVNQIAADTELSDEERAQLTQIAVSNAVAAAQNATSTAPANIANWNVQGFVYRSLVGVPGAEGFAVEAYEKSAELEPSSPFPWTELARVYTLKAQTLVAQNADEGAAEQAQQTLLLALQSLEKAIELKSDYAPAHYLMAVVYEQQGNADEAIVKLEETKQVAPNDVGLAFQLGLIYWQNKDLDKAQAELERAKQLDANYSNARYILGLVYDAQGESEKAKAEFTDIEALNPDNQEIKKILSNIENGLPALDGVTLEEPPIQEVPSEIQEQTNPEPESEEE